MSTDTDKKPEAAGIPTDDSVEMDPELQSIVFIGATLAPFFMGDPNDEEAQEAFAAFAAIDPEALAPEWPFADTDIAQQELERMVGALADGFSSDIVLEYQHLFIGSGTHPAPVWGSVFTDSKGELFGATSRELHDWMEAKGIESTTDNRMPDDHIGMTLALMAWIALSRPELLDEYLQDQFLPWAGHLLDALADEAAHPFYEGLARLTKASLDGIQKARDLEVVYPKFYR